MQSDTRRQAVDRVGTRIGGKWFLDELLGIGGCASVYAATHRNGARAAVKLLHPSIMSDDVLRARFVREGYVANKVKHPGVVAVLDDDVTGEGIPYLVMELLEGRSLERPAPNTKKNMPVPEMVRIADAVLDVLINAHAAGIVHRDLKPANIFVTKTGEVKVLDFGIARLAEANVDPNMTGATHTGMIMGTATYMPPEQARARWDEVDGRSDLFAVGATMLALVLGSRPRQADTANEDLLVAMTSGMPEARSIAPELPPAVADVINRACAFKKSERWPDAAAMQSALRAAVASPPPEPPRVRPAPDPIPYPPAPAIAPDPIRHPAPAIAPLEMGGSTTKTVFFPATLPPSTVGARESASRSNPTTIALAVTVATLALSALLFGGLFLRARRPTAPTPSAAGQPMDVVAAAPGPSAPGPSASPTPAPPPVLTAAVPTNSSELEVAKPAPPADSAVTVGPAPKRSATKTRPSAAPSSSTRFYDERF